LFNPDMVTRHALGSCCVFWRTRARLLGAHFV